MIFIVCGAMGGGKGGGSEKREKTTTREASDDDEGGATHLFDLGFLLQHERADVAGDRVQEGQDEEEGEGGGDHRQEVVRVEGRLGEEAQRDLCEWMVMVDDKHTHPNGWVERLG